MVSDLQNGKVISSISRRKSCRFLPVIVNIMHHAQYQKFGLILSYVIVKIFNYHNVDLKEILTKQEKQKSKKKIALQFEEICYESVINKS